MNPIYRFSLAALQRLLLPYWIPQVEGLEHLPREGPVLLVSNHPTVLDGLVLGSILPRQVRFMVSREPLKIPLVGHWLKALGFIAVGGKSGSLQRVAHHLSQGACVGIYPEGNPTHSYQLQEFHPGVAILAEQCGVPLIPVSTYGSEALCPENARYVRGGPVWIHFGAPLLWQPGHTRESFLQELRERIQAPLRLPPQLVARRGWGFYACAALWVPLSFALLQLADWIRPGGKR